MTIKLGFERFDENSFGFAYLAFCGIKKGGFFLSVQRSAVTAVPFVVNGRQA